MAALTWSLCLYQLEILWDNIKISIIIFDAWKKTQKKYYG